MIIFDFTHLCEEENETSFVFGKNSILLVLFSDEVLPSKLELIFSLSRGRIIVMIKRINLITK